MFHDGERNGRSRAGICEEEGRERRSQRDSLLLQLLGEALSRLVFEILTLFSLNGWALWRIAAVAG